MPYGQNEGMGGEVPLWGVGCAIWGYGVRVRGGGAGGGVSPHMPLTGQKRKLCLMALPATACLLPKKKKRNKKK